MQIRCVEPDGLGKQCLQIHGASIFGHCYLDSCFLRDECDLTSRKRKRRSAKTVAYASGSYFQSLISKIASTSTAAPNGSDEKPSACA